MGTKTLGSSNLKVGRIIRTDFSNKLSSGNGQSSTVRVKLGNTTIVSNIQALPNGLNGNPPLHWLYRFSCNPRRSKWTGKSDVVNNQLNVLTRALESVGDISIDLSQPLDVDLTYQYGAVDVANVCISRKATITIK